MRIFKIYKGDAYNCNFDRNEAFETSALDTGCGGAIYKGDATNCNFSNNKADAGGAIYEGKAYKCNFTKNKAGGGGAMYGEKAEAYFCTFNYNDKYDVVEGNVYFCYFNGKKGIWDPPRPLYDGKYASCTFNGEKPEHSQEFSTKLKVSDYNSVYRSGERLKFKLKLEDKDILSDDEFFLKGLNTTIKIYKDGSLVKTVYSLTGEGWVVDLEPGKYTVELSLTDYPKLKSKATINVKE